MEIPFAISARTAHLIGLENFANSEGAVVELVKNAYDADAETCVVVADIDDDKSKSRLFVIDNGTGMTADIIKKHWMTIGTDDKLINALSSKKERIKSGAKGIGRFALNRLGNKAEMLSFTTGDSVQGHLWKVDWRMFNEARILSEVKANLDEATIDTLKAKLHEYKLDSLPIYNNLFPDSFHGTILCISELNDIWDEDSLNGLLKNLEMLIPAHMNTAFELYLYKMQNYSWSGKINPMEYEDFDYKVTAEYSNGRKISVAIERNELNLSKLETQYGKVFQREAMKDEPYRLEDFKKGTINKTITISDVVDTTTLKQVGSFKFTFFFLKNNIKEDRDTAKKYPYNTIDESARINWLDRFGGVRIYRDEFRVRPYGENGDDWLGLGRRQAKSPGGPGHQMGGYRIRPNQIAGVVNISRLTNSAFEDKSSREGIQENDAFALFKNLLLLIISAFENDRNVIMYNLSELYKEQNPQSSQAIKIVQETLKKAPSSDGNQSKEAKDLRQLAESYQSLQNELDDKEAELSMLRGLASMGISVATSTHELRSVMLRLIPRNELLKNILLQYLPLAQFEGMRFGNPYRELEHMKDEDEKLNNWLMFTAKSIRRSKRDWTSINILKYLKDFVESWAPSLRKRNIKIILKQENLDGAAIDGCEIDFDSIFNNYVTNCISAFLTSKAENKTITINASEDHGFAVIDFIDNGKGLAPEYRDNPDVIFNAFETSTVDSKNNKIGTGMGLFIAKGVIGKYKDSMIELLPVESGFGIRTMFKIK